MALDAEERLGTSLQACVADTIATAHAIPVFVLFEAPQGRTDELKPGALCLAIRLEHLLLLDGVDPRDAPHRRLIELDRAGCFSRSVETLLELSFQGFEISAKLGKLVR